MLHVIVLLIGAPDIPVEAVADPRENGRIDLHAVPGPDQVTFPQWSAIVRCVALELDGSAHSALGSANFNHRGADPGLAALQHGDRFKDTLARGPRGNRIARWSTP